MCSHTDDSMFGTGYETTGVGTYSQGLLQNEDLDSNSDTLRIQQENPA
jgi:hypothetical protein